jgi:hypothetical protein
MKLIGSLSEAREREELVASNAELRRRDGALASALVAAGFDVTTAFVLEWIPEQAEDLFVVLVGPDRVVRVEVVRATGNVAAIEETAIGDYRPPSKPTRLRLAIALDLRRSVAP